MDLTKAKGVELREYMTHVENMNARQGFGSAFLGRIQRFSGPDGLGHGVSGVIDQEGHLVQVIVPLKDSADIGTPAMQLTSKDGQLFVDFGNIDSKLEGWPHIWPDKRNIYDAHNTLSEAIEWVGDDLEKHKYFFADEMLREEQHLKDGQLVKRIQYSFLGESLEIDYNNGQKVKEVRKDASGRPMAGNSAKSVGPTKGTIAKMLKDSEYA